MTNDTARGAARRRTLGVAAVLVATAALTAACGTGGSSGERSTTAAVALPTASVAPPTAPSTTGSLPSVSRPSTTAGTTAPSSTTATTEKPNTETSKTDPATTAPESTTTPTTAPTTTAPPTTEAATTTTEAPTTAASSTSTSEPSTTTTLPETTSSTTTTSVTVVSSSNPWVPAGIAIGVVVVAAAIGLFFFLRARRRRQATERWVAAARPAVDQSIAARNVLGGRPGATDPAQRDAIDAQAEQAASALDGLGLSAPDDETRAATVAAASGLRQLRFTLESERLLRAGTPAPTAAQLSQADEARRTAVAQLDGALASLQARTAPPPTAS